MKLDLYFKEYLFEVKDTKLNLVALDGYRLAYKKRIYR